MISSSHKFVESIEVSKLAQAFLPDFRLRDVQVTKFGPIYQLQRGDPIGTIVLQVGVYPDDRTAQSEFNRYSLLISSGPRKLESPIGDEHWVWQTSDLMSGSLAFHRANALIVVSGQTPATEKIRLAEQIDCAIQTGSGSVVHSTTLRVPTITRVDLPEMVRPGSQVTARIHVSNIRPEEALLGIENTNGIVSPGPVPQLTYFAPAHPGKDELLLIVCSPGNLMSKFSLTVEIK